MRRVLSYVTDEPTMSRTLSEDLSKLASCGKTQAALQGIARRILGDRSAAEDAVQGAYLAAWQRPPRRLSFGWMRRTVVSRAIDQKRRVAARRVAGDALDQAGPSGWEPANLTASLEAHRELGAALAQLPAAQGEALYLRYFEGLQPRAIARRLGLPLETVKTRLARGLQSLRGSLDSPKGGDGLSMRGLALVAFGMGSPKPAAVLASSSLSNLSGLNFSGLNAFGLTWLGSLSMKKWIVIACVFLLSGLAGIWTLLPNGGPGAAVAAVPEAEAPDLAAIDGAVEVPIVTGLRVEAGVEDAAAEPAEPRRDGVAALERSLEVAVTWGDGAPATGTTVGVHLDNGNGQERFLGVVTVGGDGRARLTGCLAGIYRVASSVRGEVEVEAWAPGVATGSITIPDGVNVSGVVIDSEEMPVAGAQLWVLTTLSGWQEHVEIGRTDALGRFELRDVPLYGAVGVTADGYAPSRWSPVSRMAITGTRASRDRAAELMIRLSRGGASLRGVVSGPGGGAAGGPIGGAQIAITTTVMGGALDPVGFESVQRFAHTATDGTYAVLGLQMGTVEVACVGIGFARFEAKVLLADGAAESLDIELRRGGRIAGLVTDSVGEPMAGVTVGAFTEAMDMGMLTAAGFERDAPLGWPSAKTDETGLYHLDGVVAGTAFVYALGPNEIWGSYSYRHRVDKAVLEVVVDQEITWNAMIGPGRTIVGTLLYADRTPAEGKAVTAISVSTGDARFFRAGPDGSFRFENLEDDAFEVIGAFPLVDESVERVSAYGVKPDGLPIELVAPTALDLEPTALAGTSSIIGAVSDPHGRMGKWTMFVLETSVGDDVKQARAGGANTFSFSEVKAGSYRFCVRTSELDSLLVTDAFDVAPGESKDMGTLTLGPAGGQRVHFLRDPDWPDTSGFFAVKSLDGVRVVSDMFRATDNLMELDNLNPGRYTAHVYEGHLVGRGIEFEVVAGEIGDVDFPFEVGVDVTVEVQFRPSLYMGKNGEVPEGVAVRAFSEDGDVLVDMTLSAMGFAAGRNAAGFCLPRGTVRLEASHPQAGTVSKTVVLKTIGGDAPRVELDLNP